VVNIDFPSAASIPAVNIMNPEPSGPSCPASRLQRLPIRTGSRSVGFVAALA
jgi:hypothetical protein